MGIVKYRNQRPTFMNTFFDDAFAKELFFKDIQQENNTRRPAVNVKESELKFEIELVAPGFKKDDFKLELKDRRLTLSAEFEKANTEEQVKYTLNEFNFKNIKRSFTLPKSVDEEKIEANYDNGILRVSLPKRAEVTAAPKSIKVN